MAAYWQVLCLSHLPRDRDQFQAQHSFIKYVLLHFVFYKFNLPRLLSLKDRHVSHKVGTKPFRTSRQFHSVAIRLQIYSGYLYTKMCQNRTQSDKAIAKVKWHNFFASPCRWPWRGKWWSGWPQIALEILVPLLLQHSLVHLQPLLWKPLITLLSMPHLVSGTNFLLHCVNQFHLFTLISTHLSLLHFLHPSLLHSDSKLKTYHYGKSFPPQILSPDARDWLFRTMGAFSISTLLIDYISWFWGGRLN